MQTYNAYNLLPHIWPRMIYHIITHKRQNKNEVSPLPPYLFAFLSSPGQVQKNILNSSMLTYGAYLCSKYHLYSYFKVWSECFMGTKWEQTTIQADFTFHTFFLHVVCLAETKQASKVSTKLDFNGTNNPWNMQLYLNIKSLLSTFNTFIWIKGIMVSSQSTTCSLSEALWHHCLWVMRLFP